MKNIKKKGRGQSEQFIFYFTRYCIRSLLSLLFLIILLHSEGKQVSNTKGRIKGMPIVLMFHQKDVVNEVCTTIRFL